jgi:hypothetical protein
MRWSMLQPRRSSGCFDHVLGRIEMAKGQKRSNKEIRKPKKDKEAVAPPVGMTKGIVASIGSQKKKS